MKEPSQVRMEMQTRATVNEGYRHVTSGIPTSTYTKHLFFNSSLHGNTTNPVLAKVLVTH